MNITGWKYCYLKPVKPSCMRSEEAAMPFKRIAPGKYKSPSGRTFNQSQVNLYYAKGGRFPGQKMGEQFSNPSQYKMGRMSNRSSTVDPTSSIPTRAGGQSFGPLKRY